MLRDKFAMAAMQGLFILGRSEEKVAELAYKQADAMMKERANWDFSDDPEAVSVEVNSDPFGLYQPNKGIIDKQPDWSQAPEWATIWQAWGDSTATWYDKINHTKSCVAPLFGFPPLMTSVKQRPPRKPEKRPVPPDIETPPLKTGY